MCPNKRVNRGLDRRTFLKGSMAGLIGLPAMKIAIMSITPMNTTKGTSIADRAGGVVHVDGVAPSDANGTSASGGCLPAVISVPMW